MGYCAYSMQMVPGFSLCVFFSMWGGFAVDNATLTRFFSLHFILPFVIAGMAGGHLLFFHQTGRNNPLGLNGNYDKNPFHRFLTSKDLFGFFVLFIIMRVICFFFILEYWETQKILFL